MSKTAISWSVVASLILAGITIRITKPSAEGSILLICAFINWIFIAGAYHAGNPKNQS